MFASSWQLKLNGYKFNIQQYTTMSAAFSAFGDYILHLNCQNCELVACISLNSL